MDLKIFDKLEIIENYLLTILQKLDISQEDKQPQKVHDNDDDNDDDDQATSKWSGGFGSISTFNPLDNTEKDDKIDYSFRPQKIDINSDELVIYIYEQAGNTIEIDHQDLERVLDKIGDGTDKLYFEKSLRDAVNGILQLNSHKEPGIHTQVLRIKDYQVKIYFIKSSPVKSLVNQYSRLFK